VWKSGLSAKVKAAVASAKVLSTLLYGAETANHSVKDLNSMRVFATSSARQINRWSRRGQCRKARMVLLPDPARLIAQRRLKFASTLLQCPPCELARMMLHVEVAEPGRPQTKSAAASNRLGYWQVLDRDLAFLSDGWASRPTMTQVLASDKPTAVLAKVVWQAKSGKECTDPASPSCQGSDVRSPTAASRRLSSRLW
jgi:hypothetical protein